MIPERGTWYRLNDGQTFEVTHFDEEDDLIEIQHLDGTLGELGARAWTTWENHHQLKKIDGPWDRDNGDHNPNDMLEEE